MAALRDCSPVPTDGDVVSSQFGRRTSGGTSRGNSKHFGHTPFSDHSYQPEHPSATRNHPNSQQGLDRSSCLLDTFSSPNSGFNDFSSSSVQSDSGDKHPSVVNTEFTPTTGFKSILETNEALGERRDQRQGRTASKYSSRPKPGQSARVAKFGAAVQNGQFKFQIGAKVGAAVQDYRARPCTCCCSHGKTPFEDGCLKKHTLSLGCLFKGPCISVLDIWKISEF